MPIVLLLATDDGPSIEYPILSKTTIGRSSRCDLVVEDKQMSGKHGFFECNTKGQLFYTDLGSTNGSFIDNSQIQKVQFKINDVLRVGNTNITIDAKKLNSRESMEVGVNLAKKNSESLSIPEIRGINIPADPDNQQKSVVLNKDIKSNAPKHNWKGGRNESLIEPYESSGNTQSLILEKNKAKKKS
jgi:pSer/pThr/pTyr-binding forkhead associated (FHA) protein